MSTRSPNTEARLPGLSWATRISAFFQGSCIRLSRPRGAVDLGSGDAEAEGPESTPKLVSKAIYSTRELADHGLEGITIAAVAYPDDACRIIRSGRYVRRHRHRIPVDCRPDLPDVYRPAEAVALTALCSLAGQVLSIALLRRRIAYEYRLSLILPGLIGVPLGSTVLDVCSPSLIHLSLGALSTVAAIWGLLQPTTRPARSLGGTCEALVPAPSVA
jgi:hypothetical protein